MGNVKPWKRFKNQLRQKITIQVQNRPWRTFWLTLIAGIAVGGATSFLITYFLLR